MPLPRAQIESLLRARQLDRTLTTAIPVLDTRDESVLAPSSLRVLDARLGGGFPRGQLSEIVGPRSSGRASLMLRMLAAATARGELTALVDVVDMLDVESAAAAGVDLDRLLWIRGHVAVHPGPCRDLNQRALEQTTRALTLVLQAGNFGLVVFDAGESPLDAIRRLPFTTWLRLQRMVEGSPTACVLVGADAMARSSAGLTLRLGAQATGFGESLFNGIDMEARVVRARAREQEVSACLYRPPAPDVSEDGRSTPVPTLGADAHEPIATALVTIAREFSPRYECHGDDLVSIDVGGLGRLLGPPKIIGAELRRESAARGIRAHVAVAGTRMTALLLAYACPGLTVIPPGEEAAALASIPIAILGKCHAHAVPGIRDQQKSPDADSVAAAMTAFRRWGLRTLGELAALPSTDLVSRLGRSAMAWQAMARGEDLRPLIPMLDEERFESSLDLEWPVDGLEPLSFVLTRLLEPLSTRLERRDRGAAVLHVILHLVTRSSALRDNQGAGAESREIYVRRLELPTPLRDVRALRTLALLDLESHPPDAAIDRVTIVIDPTPGRVLQHTLFTRAHPTPEQLSTLLARLGAVMGQDRVGAPALVESYRPGAFVMKSFATDHSDQRRDGQESSATSPESLRSALRRCRQPVPARVTTTEGRPVRVTSDRREFAGGAVLNCAGPWRTSGEWWLPPYQTHPASWDRDEWDVALADGAVYRVFQDRAGGAWFIDAIVD